MLLRNSTMVLGDPYWQLHRVLSVFLDKILISRVKREIEPQTSRNCNDSDLESSRYTTTPPGSPGGWFYACNWVTGRWLQHIFGSDRHPKSRGHWRMLGPVQVSQWGVVRLKSKNPHLRSAESHVFRFRATFMDVLRSPVHRFTNVWASSENSGTQRRHISGV